MIGVGLEAVEALSDCLASMGCSEAHIGVEDLDALAGLSCLSDSRLTGIAIRLLEPSWVWWRIVVAVWRAALWRRHIILLWRRAIVPRRWSSISSAVSSSSASSLRKALSWVGRRSRGV
jgi:hypothetical protein